MDSQRLVVQHNDNEKILELSFDDLGVLTISEVFIDEENNEQMVPVIIQPHKNNPDGSRVQWADAQEAFDWANSIKHEVA
jgi:hypothetical protein